MLDRHDLYELCAQSPADLVPLLAAIHGREPKVLGEDFCGTAALSAQWVRSVPGGRAVAADRDPKILARARSVSEVQVVEADLRRAAPDGPRPDVIYAGNFSIGELHDRADLLGYLRRARQRLGEHGVLVCDLYGGETAFLTGDTDLDHPGPDGCTVRYTWEQRRADPLTGMVINAMHFQVLRDGAVERELRDAFVYRWRLWGVPELRDAMAEAGFAATAVYHRVPDAVDDEGRAYVAPITDPADLEDSFDVLVAGRS